MRKAAQEDRLLVAEKKMAVKKLSMLGQVEAALRVKANVEDYLEAGILLAIKKWLEPLPDKSLPNVRIRNSLLKSLADFQPNEDQLRESGIGRIVNYLSYSPKETQENRRAASLLVDSWARVAFNLQENESRDETEKDRASDQNGSGKANAADFASSAVGGEGSNMDLTWKQKREVMLKEAELRSEHIALEYQKEHTGADALPFRKARAPIPKVYIFSKKEKPELSSQPLTAPPASKPLLVANRGAASKKSAPKRLPDY